MLRQSGVFALVGACSLMGSASAQGQLIYSTSFESPTFAVGALAGQESWSSANTFPNSAASSAQWRVANTAGSAFDGSQFIAVTPAAGDGERFIWSSNTGVTPAMLAVNPVVSASAAVRVNTSLTSTLTAGAGIALYGSSGSSQIGLIRLLANGDLQVFNAAGNGVNFGAGVVTTGTWQQLRIEADFSTSVARFYLGSTLLNPLFPPTFSTSFTATDVSDLDLYSVSGSSGLAGHTLWYDAVRVEAIPAPGGAAVLGIGAFMCRRRRGVV